LRGWIENILRGVYRELTTSAQNIWVT